MNKNGKNRLDIQAIEIDDEQLDQVVGGLQVPVVGRIQITTCDNFVCCWCGQGKNVLGEGSHGCKAQGHGDVHVAPDGTVHKFEAVFANTCEWCEYSYSCSLAYTYKGLGSPTPPNG